MKQFFITVAGVMTGLLLFFIGVPVVIIMMVASATKPAPPPTRSLLSIDLRQGLSDQDARNPFASLGAPQRSVMSMVQQLHAAESDDHIRGILVRLPESGLAPAVADELALAFKAFRATGKPITAVSQGLYAAGIAPATYRLGAAADTFWMQPGAALQATGVASEEMFLKRFFDRYGLMADFEKRYEYKNAVNPMTESDYTPAHREATLS
ncbi:MAG: S49 family peptidase, partial [Caulobacteraceae bacterium]